MDGDQVIYIVLCLAIVICTIYEINKWTKNVWFSIVFVAGSVILLLSHIWHVIWGEELASMCDTVLDTQWVGWSQCPWDWNNLIDSYEITVMIEVTIIEILFISHLAAYFKCKLKPWAIVLITYSSIQIAAAIMLSIFSYEILKEYVDYFNIFGIIICFQKSIVLLTRSKHEIQNTALKEPLISRHR